MANYTSMARTNYFRVKDIDAFKADLNAHGITPVSFAESAFGGIVLDESEHNSPQGAVALFSHEGWPSFDEEMIADRLGLDESETLPAFRESIEELVGAHLVDEHEIAVFMTIGWEKLRYLTGVAVAVNSAGEIRNVNLDDIYSLAEELLPEDDIPAQISTATY